jgi:hypothetical protein
MSSQILPLNANRIPATIAAPIISQTRIASKSFVTPRSLRSPVFLSSPITGGMDQVASGAGGRSMGLSPQ